MAIRIFRCESCGHRLRLGAGYCGKCTFPTLARNRTGTWLLVLLALPVLLVAVATVVL
jgi:ribosomal protein L37AE/L43A